MPLSYPEAFESLVELYRSSHRRCSKTKGILIIFAKFTGPEICNFIERETLVQVFSHEFCKTFKNTYFEEHL